MSEKCWADMEPVTKEVENKQQNVRQRQPILPKRHSKHGGKLRRQHPLALP